VLNSRDFGVPQNRERVFIIGRSRAHRGREVFPIRGGEGGNPEAHAAASGEGQRVQDEGSDVAGTVRPGARSARNSTVVSCLDANYYKGSRGDRTLVELTDTGTPDAQRVYDADGIAKTIKSSNGGLGSANGLYLIRKNMNGPDRVEREGKWLECEDGDSPTVMTKWDYNARVIYKQGFGQEAKMAEGDTVPPLKASDAKYGDSSPMIIHRNQRGEVRASDESGAVQTTMHGNNTPKLFMEARIRRLTPRECERLQGFPDDWTAEGVFNGKVKKISDTQRYKCLGNSVVTNVIYEIARSL
jgi:DNA (cytosine-5)-methyltransferase 1